MNSCKLNTLLGNNRKINVYERNKQKNLYFYRNNLQNIALRIWGTVSKR